MEEEFTKCSLIYSQALRQQKIWANAQLANEMRKSL